MSEAAARAANNGPLVVGRYALFDELAAGGMATVHLGRLLGSAGFGRTVAIKRLHAHYLSDQEFLTMFMDEARIVARIRHPNVVGMVDVVQSDKGLFLVMEYIHGESLSRLLRTARQCGERIPPRVVAAIMCGVLHGLHAAHETRGPDNELLGVVHRDVSPQNIIIGADGSARVLDFGIAKAAGRAQVTREGQIKGKLAYMAPEQIRGKVDRRTDVFAASVVLWEMLTGRRLHEGHKDVDIVLRVVKGTFPAPSQVAPDLSHGLDAIVMRGLASNPDTRYASALDLALELERAIGLAAPTEVAAWIQHLAPEVLQARANLVTAMELAANDLIASESNAPPPSLAMAEVTVPRPPSAPHFPIDVDMSNAVHEVPSTSAVFAHRQGEPRHQEVHQPSSALKLTRTAWVVVLVSLLFALVGLVFGVLAVLARGARGSSAVPAATESPSPSPSPPPSPPPSPSPSPSPSASSTSSSSDSPVIDLDAVPSASTVASSAPSASAVAPGKPWKPASKNCTPPYTIDAAGRQHYKPECMGL